MPKRKNISSGRWDAGVCEKLLHYPPAPKKSTGCCRFAALGIVFYRRHDTLRHGKDADGGWNGGCRDAGCAGAAWLEGAAGGGEVGCEQGPGERVADGASGCAWACSGVFAVGADGDDMNCFSGARLVFQACTIFWLAVACAWKVFAG